MMNTINLSIVILLAIVLLSCSKSDFKGERSSLVAQADSETGNEEASSGTRPEIVLEVSEEGLIGGHFDLDIATQIYPPSQGSTDGHVHEYDKKFKVNGADFLDLKDRKLPNIQDVIAPGQSFSFVVLNANLSSLASLNINGQSLLAKEYQNQDGLKTLFSLGDLISGTEALEKLMIVLPLDALERNGLVATATSCVRSNRSGPNGEYRNGALTLQAVDPDRYASDPVTGWTTAGLLWEATLFWHKDNNCL